MLKTEMIKKLNEQMNLEFFSSRLYLQMSAWCSANAFEGAANFLRDHAREEHDHMLRLFDYLDGTGSLPVISANEAPEAEYVNLLELFEKTYEHEKLITESINQLADIAFTSKDYSTFNFLQWYVAEQHEEEKLFKSIVDKIKLVGNNGDALYLLDKDIGNMSNKI
ncbi:non-heme ferritin [Salmonella enterica]|uniref:Ferritin n=1 Tax=Salmonella enterica subsp. houtenae serovar 45:g,z51:- TaxID=1967611 RepID=A0A736VI18_SALHO|nr:non-heme ferritin [Salmonella enterica]ECG1391789.1 non-heme ferritin [Salmonella enterica subsp. houtenae str. CFSAN000557]EDT6888540.1 non-heme ferritin [Salmonella enterica subsp. enterica]HAE7767572.1 non-heme ferritin [Salmonella enterica subsp. houtenae serovar 45:g,z51:-]ECJ9309717.1 non-heme ferritin [Salmonella enterica]